MACDIQTFAFSGTHLGLRNLLPLRLASSVQQTSLRDSLIPLISSIASRTLSGEEKIDESIEKKKREDKETSEDGTKEKEEKEERSNGKDDNRKDGAWSGERLALSTEVPTAHKEEPARLSSSTLASTSQTSRLSLLGCI